MGLPLLLFFFYFMSDTIHFHDVSLEAGITASHRAICAGGSAPTDLASSIWPPGQPGPIMTTTAGSISL